MEVSKIRDLAGLSDTISNENISIHINKALQAIRDYTNRLFLTKLGVKKAVVKIDGTKITSLEGIKFESYGFSNGCYIELLGSELNSRLLTIKEIIDDVIYVTEELESEEVITDIARVSFASIGVDLVASMVKSSITTLDNGGVIKQETIDVHSVTYMGEEKSVYMGYPLTLLSPLAGIRAMPDNKISDLLRNGYTSVRYGFLERYGDI